MTPRMARALEMGGREWRGNAVHRVYVDNWPMLVGFTVDPDGTGRIDGWPISPRVTRMMGRVGCYVEGDNLRMQYIEQEKALFDMLADRLAELFPEAEK